MDIAELDGMTGYIGEIIIPPETKVPEVTVKVNFDTGTYSDAADPEKEFIAAQQKETKNLIGLTDFTGSQTYDYLHKLAEATTEYNAAVSAGDTDTANAWADSISYLGQCLGNEAGYNGGMGFQAMAQLVANGMQLLSDGELSPEDAQQLMQVMTDMQTVLSTPLAADSAWSTYTNQSFQEGLASAFNVDQGWGDTTAENVQSQLQAGMESLRGNFESLGADASAGIGTGAEGYDFSGNTGGVQTNFSEDADASFGRGSPCSTMMPLGRDVAAGIGAGAAEYGFSGDTAKVAQNLRTAAGTSFGTSLLKSAGLNAMTGLAAGIRSGTSYVTSAIRTAAEKAVREAKDALVIKSPSHVFRDEVGAMAMKGFGEGVTEESARQAKIIRNAARYLTGEAREGVIAAGSTDNRRTYNQQSTVNLSGNTFYIREQQDITSLAREIAALTKRRQAGRGMA